MKVHRGKVEEVCYYSSMDGWIDTRLRYFYNLEHGDKVLPKRMI